MTDRETGEQRSVTLERQQFGGRRQEASRGFAMVWIDGAIDAGLSARQLGVLMLLAEKADLRGIADYRLDKLAERLDCDQGPTWRAIQQLIEKDVVRRIGRGRVQVNPNVIWQGPISDRSAAMVRWHNALDAAPFSGERKYSA